VTLRSASAGQWPKSHSEECVAAIATRRGRFAYRIAALVLEIC
jgi:hypothetical protein